MNCGIIDVQCKLTNFFAPFIFWGKIAVIAIIILAVLAGLAWVYRNFGWWGVLVAVSFGAAAAIFHEGVKFGKQHSEVLPDTPDKPIKHRHPHTSAPVNDGVWNKWINGEKVD